MARKKKPRENAPVPNGCDRRGTERQRDEEPETTAKAPDGVSGSWG